jgi:aldehyde:ferredoxin oxidoreductase
MNPITVRLPRFDQGHPRPPLCWANRLLRVDLSAGRIWAEETAPRVPDYMGARGLAAKICWDEYPEPVAPLDPANPLMVMPGALTGSRAPYAGRTNVCAFSPQAYPHPWFTRSSIGGRFGGELKRAGYDGLVITGAADAPVRLRICDDEVSLLPADDLWGLDTFETLEALQAAEGEGSSALVIGPAGERLSAIATIQTDTSSACGQGGFGAVMGSKRLKAISVAGSGQVRLARPETITALARALAPLVSPPSWFGEMRPLNERLAAQGGGQARLRPCTEGCLTPCTVEFEGVEGCTQRRKWSGDWVCIATDFQGHGPSTPAHLRDAFDWELDLNAAFELNVLSNRYGINQFDILTGLVPWLISCQKAGLIGDLSGLPLDFRSPACWAALLHAIAYREGLGDALADGGWAAAQRLGLGVAQAARLYTGWGQSNHWDGHGRWNHPFPYWLPMTLQWLADTRDPISAGHGSLKALGVARPIWQTDDFARRAAALAEAREFGRRVYGEPEAADPYSGYRGKAVVGHFHTLRPVLKDCVPVDDQVFPLLWQRGADDPWPVLRDIPGVGDVEGPDVEYQLFVAGTGLDWSRDELQRAVERVMLLERALQVRHWGRDRAMDEMILPYFEQLESYANPLLGHSDGQRQGLDRAQFAPVVDEFYRLLGWDVATGWPTPAALAAVGLADVYAPMVAGAARANAR